MQIIIFRYLRFSSRVGGLPIMAYTGRLRPKGVSFLGFRYIKKVGFLLVEVYERVGKSVIWAVKGSKGLPDEFYGFIKLRKRSIFVIDSYLSHSASFTAVKRDAKF